MRNQTERLAAATAKAKRAAARASRAEQEAEAHKEMAQAAMAQVRKADSWEGATEGAKAIVHASWEQEATRLATKARAAAERAWRAEHTARRAAQEAAKAAAAIAADPMVSLSDAEDAAEMACEAEETSQSAWEDAYAAEGWANEAEGKEDPWGIASQRSEDVVAQAEAEGNGSEAWEATMARANGQIAAKAARQAMGR